MNSFQYFVFFLFLGTALALKNDKNCDLKVAIQKCIKSGFLLESGDKKFKSLPKTMTEMNSVCEELKKSEQCTKNFIDQCADSEKEKKVLDHSLEGMVRVLKRLCRTNSKKTEFIANSEKCGNAVLKDGLKCVRDYKKNLFAANKLNDKSKIMRIMCCKIRDIGPCIGEAMKKKGDAVCTKSNIDYFKRVKETFKEEITSVICADFEKDKCQDVQVPSIADSEVVGSLIVPMKQIMDKVLV